MRLHGIAAQRRHLLAHLLVEETVAKSRRAAAMKNRRRTYALRRQTMTEILKTMLLLRAGRR